MKCFTFALAMLLVPTGFVMADDTKCTGKCDAKGEHQCATLHASGPEKNCCGLTAGMQKLPKIEYMVGETKTCCEESAKAQAASTDAKVVYVVGEETFEDSNEAFVSLVEQTEQFVDAFATPKSCSESGTTKIAGESLTCSVKAGEVAAKVKKAMDGIAISYKVGEQVCQCPVEAKTLALEKKLKTLFVVDSEEMECEYAARLSLARAKYKAALIATAPIQTITSVE